MLFLDGIYIGGTNGLPIRFRQVKAPTGSELTELARKIASRVGRYLERQGLLERDGGNIYLTRESVATVGDLAVLSRGKSGTRTLNGHFCRTGGRPRQSRR